MSQSALTRLLQTKTRSANIEAGQMAAFTPDLIVLTDTDASMVFDQLAGREIVAKAVLLTGQENTELRKKAGHAGVNVEPCIDPLTTLIETSRALPGDLVIANLPGICGLGGIGAVGMRCTPPDLANALQGQPIETRVPGAFKASLMGELPTECDGLDLFLELHSQGMVAGVSLEVSGPGSKDLSLMQRLRVASWAGLNGAAQIFVVPDKTLVQELNAIVNRSFTTFEPASEAIYAGSFEVELGRIRPRIITPDGQVVTSVEASGQQPNAAHFGGAGTCGLPELKRIRDVFRNHRPTVPVTVCPDSRAITDLAAAEDVIDHLEDFGVRIIKSPEPPAENSVVTGVSGKGCYKASTETALLCAVQGQFGPPQNPGKDVRDSKLSGRLPRAE
ncbi:MAG: aconitase family protein [Planctomycetota bacterium]|jgi:homoaconitase/3-isopropylmalate dehydratase large subunit